MLPPELDLVVHATHEAGSKVGGIGAVLDGILAEPAYTDRARRTVLVGPFDPNNRTEMERLAAPRNGFRVLYSTLGGQSEIDLGLARALERIELYYHVNLMYGLRRFGAAEHEVLLVDPHDAVSSVTDLYKYHLWQQYGIDSLKYESHPDYERYIAAAEPSYAALQALVGEGEFPRPPALRMSRQERSVMLAHEWLGLPLVLSARWHAPGQWKTVFYAHEVATVRRLVESDPGRDTRFYNVMRTARERGLFLEDVFGDQRDFFKHGLLMATPELDGMFAVSDVTMEELQFLSPAFAARPIALVYNGVPSPAVTLEEREAARARMKEYAHNLVGGRPTWMFTHVTRLVESKGLWRDLRVMEQLDQELAARGETAVLFTLSSSIPAGRRMEDILRWESEYGWPVKHRENNGDLDGPEIDYNRATEAYNGRALASRIVLINQFGWGPDRLGTRAPEDLRPSDARYGTDLEFGQSIYEPFGIGQVESLSTGAICCLSDVCGCLGSIRQAGGAKLPNLVVGNYTSLPPSMGELDLAGLLQLGRAQRELVEAAEAARLAPIIMERLPREAAAAQRLLEDGRAVSGRMSWQVIVTESLLPALVNMF